MSLTSYKTEKTAGDEQPKAEKGWGYLCFLSMDEFFRQRDVM
jgi:hypothetical protein